MRRLSAWVIVATNRSSTRGSRSLPAVLHRGADCGDETLGDHGLVDPIAETGGEQAFTLDLGESRKRDCRHRGLEAAGHFHRANAPQRFESILARHGEVDEKHVRRTSGKRALE